MKVVILIDYDNLQETQKISGLLNIVNKVLMKLPKNISTLQGLCDVRIYGGWYEEEIMTRKAQDLSVAVQTEFPTIITIPIANGFLKLKVNADLAITLAEEPSHYLFNTYRKKNVPKNIKVLSATEVGCTHTNCALSIAKKLITTGRCPTSGCTIITPNLVYRNEQKLVDTMLTCDLIYYSMQSYEYIMLISEDDDFIPPIRTVMMRGSKIYRIFPKLNSSRISSPILGAHLIETEL